MTDSTSPPTILRIAVPSPFWEPLDYAPAATSTQWQPGQRVRAPLGNREVVGVLVAVEDSSSLDKSKIKPVHACLDETPLWSPTGFALCLWAVSYYRHPIGAAFSDIMPSLLRQGSAAKLTPVETYSITGEGLAFLCSGSKRAPKQREVLEQLQQTPAQTRAQLGGVSLKPLLEKNHIESTEQAPTAWKYVHKESMHTLNEQQQVAVDAVLGGTGFSPFLLFGITGSGKTEVYFHVMKSVLREQKQVLFLVPEISLTPQTLQRIERAFCVPVVSYHSKLSDRRRLDAWLQAKEGQAAIVVGTRSAVFSSFKKLGLIVVDEEHDGSYKQQSSFRYNARDCALKRAQLDGIPIILGSATPSLRTYANAKSGRYGFLQLTGRACTQTLPERRCLQLSSTHYQEGVSEELKKIIQVHLDNKKQVLLFLNRRGFAPLYLCPACQHIIRCTQCDANMTYHQNKSVLVCHHCNCKQKTMTYCPSCKRAEMIGYGLGTEQLEQAANKHFPGQRILRVDRDTMSKRGTLEAALADIESEKVDIIVGTQMLAKGHHFPKLTCVVVINADQGFLSSDFRSAEQSAALIEQVSGRAGRESDPGEVILQTLQSENPYLSRLMECGYLSLADQLLEESADAGLPPKTAMAVIAAESKTPGVAENFLQSIKRRMPTGGFEWMGPMPAILSKRANWYRFQLCLIAKTPRELQENLDAVIRHLSATKNNRVRWFLDVDPYSLA